MLETERGRTTWIAIYREHALESTMDLSHNRTHSESYLSKVLLLNYKEQIFNSVYGSNDCWFWQSYWTPKYTV